MAEQIAAAQRELSARGQRLSRQGIARQMCGRGLSAQRPRRYVPRTTGHATESAPPENTAA